MKYANIKNSIHLKFFLASLLLAVFVIFVLVPKTKMFWQNFSSLKNNQKQILFLQQKKQELQKLQKDKNKIKSILTKSENLIPQKAETSYFLSQIDAVLFSNGISTQSISMSEPKSKTSAEKTDETTKSTGGSTLTQQSTTQKTQEDKTQKYRTYAFSLSFTTDFPKLKNFLKMSETLGRFNRITSLNLTVAENQLLEVKIEGEILSKK